MEPRRRVLIAAQPAAVIALEHMLEPGLDVVYALTMAEAIRALDGSSVDIIICTIAFDESRMLEFLLAVKASPATKSVRFICVRVLRSALSDHLVDQLGSACREGGAAHFLDLAKMRQPEALAALSAALRA